MNLIIASDIFGKTAHLVTFAEQFSTFYRHTRIIDPYAGQELPFACEADAYMHFQQHCGLAQLTDHLATAVRQTDGPFDIIGFSVGGSAAWRICGQDLARQARSIVCFYGSRIRQYTDIVPQCPTSLIFPAREEGFELEPLINSVTKKPNVEVVRTGYLHGFMNRKSGNFSEIGYKEFCSWFTTKLQN